MVAIVGENGSGKTSLVKLIAGVLSPDSGQVSLQSAFGSTVDPEVIRNSGVRTLF